MTGGAFHDGNVVTEKKVGIPMVIVLACAASLLVVFPWAALGMRRALSFSLIREDLFGWVLILLPHTITMILCIVVPGALAIGLALGVGAMTGLLLLIIVPALGILMSIKPEDQADAKTFMAIGALLIAIQVAIVVSARMDLRAARAAGSEGGSLGIWLGPAYVGLVVFVLLTLVQTKQHAQDARPAAELRAEVRRDRIRYSAPDSSTVTRDEANSRLFFILRCVSLRFDSVRTYPGDLRSLGPGRDNCLDSVTASGKFGRWRVVYRPIPPGRGHPYGGYVLSATDTANIEQPLTLGRTH